MSTGRFWRSFQVGCTYVGTVVGAGFASGREILQFFGHAGPFGYGAIAVATALFAWLGYRVMELGRRLRAGSCFEANTILFGRYLGGLFNAVYLLMLFGITAAMLAGAGELFRERAGVPFFYGGALTVLITYWTILRGLDGVMRANTVIAPLLVGFVLYATVSSIFFGKPPAGGAEVWFAGSGRPLWALLSAVVYAAFNIGLAAGVLIPLGCDMQDPVVLRRGAMLGAGGLGVMVLAILVTLYHHPEAVRFQMPMAFVAQVFGGWFEALFVLVLWGEIYSTLVGNVYAMVAQMPRERPHYPRIAAAVILLLGFVCSHVGFANLVAYGYTAFGVVSVMLLLALVWPYRRA
ncbi:MAG: GerAB/ArcD/ProY family transporter [Alicyclobacillaceae bacterium]|nr:GerAB/ArcD/ProY family transporter [Alicyclobacillaceae bacterium]